MSNESRAVEDEADRNFKVRNILLALLCAFLGSVKGLLVSQVQSLGPVEIFGLRSAGSVCFILPLIVHGNFRLWYDFKCNLVLLLRSVIGNVAVCGYYYGFTYLPLAEASLLFYSTPVYTMIIGFLFLRERCGCVEIASILLSVAGVALVCVPDFSWNSDVYSPDVSKGVLGSLVGAVAQAAALAVIRKVTHVPPAVVALWWAVVGVVFSATLSLTWVDGIGLWKCGLEQICVVSVAVAGFACELLLIAALKATDAVIVSIALTSEILWAFVLQVLLTRRMPGMVVVGGGVAILLSVLLPPAVGIVQSRNSSFKSDRGK